MDNVMFNELLSSVKETREIINGQTKPSRIFIKNPNPKIIREKLSLTQEQFSKLMNISVYTIRNWEQGRREPEGAAKVLLNVVNYHPEVLRDLAYW